MPVFLLVVAGILLVSAWRNTQGDLLAALVHDVPGFATWAAAVAAIGGLGFIPGLKVPSRWMLALVLLVIFLRHYQDAIHGFEDAVSGAGSKQASNPDPATQIAANPAKATVTRAAVEGTTDASSVTTPAGQSSPLDPQHFLTAFLEQAGVSALMGAVA